MATEPHQCVGGTACPLSGAEGGLVPLAAPVVSSLQPITEPDVLISLFSQLVSPMLLPQQTAPMCTAPPRLSDGKHVTEGCKAAVKLHMDLIIALNLAAGHLHR